MADLVPGRDPDTLAAPALRQALTWERAGRAPESQGAARLRGVVGRQNARLARLEALVATQGRQLAALTERVPAQCHLGLQPAGIRQRLPQRERSGQGAPVVAIVKGAPGQLIADERLSVLMSVRPLLPASWWEVGVTGWPRSDRGAVGGRGAPPEVARLARLITAGLVAHAWREMGDRGERLAPARPVRKEPPQIRRAA